MDPDELERLVGRLRPYGTVIFDLDGTLVRLQVDWRKAQAELGGITRRYGKDSAGRSIWAMLRDAMGDEAAELSRALQRYEMKGSTEAQPLPISEVLPLMNREQVGVVTLNCHSCAEEALRVTGLSALVGAIVAREDTTRVKPDPEPLLLCIQRLQGEPDHAVFVGDRERDRETAEAAGTSFLSVHDLLRPAATGK
ncbi:MAG: HAD family hydrolase [Thermoplasmata archaeon]